MAAWLQELVARGAETWHAPRGGEVTFHGPRQLVAYPVLDIRCGLTHAAYIAAGGCRERPCRTDFVILGLQRLVQPAVWDQQVTLPGKCACRREAKIGARAFVECLEDCVVDTLGALCMVVALYPGTRLPTAEHNH
eukprot:365495-Chlamydomonas_euryale.AAC.12